jgi:mannose-6-phosphate isomerase class I
VAAQIEDFSVVQEQSVADRITARDPVCVDEFRCSLIVPFNNNLVPRPWGGSKLLEFKGLDEAPQALAISNLPAGEAFEIAACDDDDEARKYPSVVACSDGSAIELPDLLAAYGEALLGEAFIARHGPQFPLLPKLLDIKELLSVQGHPPGHTEAYIVIDAEPDATIRLGFSADVDAQALAAELTAGRREQRELRELIRNTATTDDDVQQLLAPWLATRRAPPEDIAAAVVGLLESESDWSAVRTLLVSLKRLYWRMLDALNSIPVSAGQVIHNATPARLLGDASAVPTAEVHALGNPERKEILALEVRRPGPTFRAWDNVRFPMRDIEIEHALDVLNLGATTREDFIAIPELVPGRPGVYCSIDSENFRIEHLRPADALGDRIAVPAEGAHCLHVISGRVEIDGSETTRLGTLRKGQSALVPVGVGEYRVSGAGGDCEVVKVSLPV